MFLINRSILVTRIVMLSSMSIVLWQIGNSRAFAQNNELIELPCELNSSCSLEEADTTNNQNSNTTPSSTNNNLAQAVAQQTDPELIELDSELVKERKETEIIQEEQKQAEAAQKIEEAIKAKNDAVVPESNITPLPGDITGQEKLKHENETIAYQELEIITQEIARIISNKIPNSSSILVHDNSLIAKSSLYRLFQGELDFLDRTYDSEIELISSAKNNVGSSQDSQASTQSLSTILTIPRIATGFTKQIAEFTSLFNSNQTFGNVNLDISQNAVVSQIASAIKENEGKDIAILNPTSFGMDFTAYNDLLARIDKLNQKKLEIIKNVSQLSLASNNSNNPYIERANQINQSFDEIAKGLTAIDEATGKTSTQLLVEGATIDKIINQPNAYVLQLEIKTEGSFRLRKNVFTGTNLRRGSGASVNYTLLNNKGEIVASDVLYRNSPYLKRDEIENNVGE